MRWRLAAVDIAVALFLFAWSLAEVWGSGAYNLVGPAWANAAAFCTASLLVAVRRWRPLLVLVTQCAVVAVPVAVWGASESLGGLLPPLVLMYTVAAHAPRRHVVIGVVAMTTTALFSVVRDPLLTSPEDYLGALPFLLLVGVASLLGAYARTRRLYLDALSERALAADREAEQQARLAVLHERQRVAQELHDVIAHGLIVMIRQVEAGLARITSDPPRARASLEAVAETGRDALHEVRLLVAVLDEPTERSGGDEHDRETLVGAYQPGLSALESLAGRMRAAGLSVRVDLEQPMPERVPPGIDVAAYRIVQEALTNALRHGHAESATVLVRRTNDALLVDVEDDGPGSALADPPGRGLVGMSERARALGGTVSIQPARPHGCRVSAWIPLPQLGVTAHQ